MTGGVRSDGQAAVTQACMTVVVVMTMAEVMTLVVIMTVAVVTRIVHASNDGTSSRRADRWSRSPSQKAASEWPCPLSHRASYSPT